VERQLDDWPEKGQRETRWVTPAEAATLVGFADQAHLTRTFRRAVGVTPARYARAP
jgi:AraC-like DNA-binding protein